MGTLTASYTLYAYMQKILLFTGGCVVLLFVTRAIDNFNKFPSEREISSSAGNQEFSSSTVTPEIHSSVVRPAIMSSAMKPDINLSSVEPETKSSTVKPEFNLATIQLEINSSVVKPDINLSAVKQDMNSSYVQLEINSSRLNPEMNSSKATPAMNSTAGGSAGNTSERLMLGLPWQQGGLGNQMFQYAALIGVAAKHNRRPFVLPGSMVTQVFQINPEYTFFPDGEQVKYWKAVGANNDKKPKIFDKTLFEPLPQEQVKIRGFTQSFKYFQDTELEIKKEFRFNANITRYADMLFSSIVPSDDNITTVGVHVRRGDFTDKYSKDIGRITPSKTYFNKAMDYFRDKYKHIKFVVVSNDVGWAKANVLGEDVMVVEPASGWVHLAVLSKCHHMIMSGGTYGFWAAYLAGGGGIFYNTPYKNGSVLADGYLEEDFQLPTWVGMGD